MSRCLEIEPTGPDGDRMALNEPPPLLVNKLVAIPYSRRVSRPGIQLSVRISPWQLGGGLLLAVGTILLVLKIIRRD